MPNQELLRIDKYNATFPTILRKLMMKHPHTGNSTTQKSLAKILNIRPQTVSLYMNGITQPTPDTLINMAKYFDVSVDYLLTGIGSYNRDTYEHLGLVETSIKTLQYVNELYSLDKMPKVLDILNNLLSDYSFYEFLNELSVNVDIIHDIAQLPSKQLYGVKEVDIESYYHWRLQMCVQVFIQKQLAKNGLVIKNLE